MIIRLFTIVCFFLFISTAQGGDMVESLYSAQELLVNNISKKIAKDLSNQYGIYYSGVGGDIKDDIKKLALSFNCYREINIEEARKLLVSCSQKYLNEINESNDLRSYLHNFPFSINDMEVSIYFFKPNRANVDINQLCIAEVVYGTLFYKKWKSEYSMEKILEESFEEALQIVRRGK